MLDRLEAERGDSAARALSAQEAERRRIAQELHDEVGQTLTAVLLELKRVADHVPEPVREESSATGPTCCTSSDSRIGSSSPATRSAPVSSSRD
jgi:signal transduction histidine kinase